MVDVLTKVGFPLEFAGLTEVRLAIHSLPCLGLVVAGLFREVGQSECALLTVH